MGTLLWVTLGWSFTYYGFAKDCMQTIWNDMITIVVTIRIAII